MKDITVQNYIPATTEPILKQNLYGIPTAREMWSKMPNQYAARAGDLEHVYYQHMYDIKYDAGTHFKIVLFFHWKILSHLPESYAQFRTRWGETLAVDRTGWASSVRMLICICGTTTMTPQKDHLDKVIYIQNKKCNNKSIDHGFTKNCTQMKIVIILV